MNIDDIKGFIPLKAQAEAAMSKQDYAAAAEYIMDFADHLIHYFRDGDKSNDSLRAAYLGMSSAALILGQVNHNKAEEYSREALEFSYKLYDEKNSPDNAIKVVTSTQVLLLNADLLSYSRDSSYYDETIDLAERLVGFLKKYFPNEEIVNHVINAYKQAYVVFDNRVKHIKMYKNLDSDRQIWPMAAANALADSAEFKYMYRKYWRRKIDEKSDAVVIALHAEILNDESLDFARQCRISEVCTTEHAEDWDGFSDELLDSYDQVCKNYGIEPIEYYGLSDSLAIPFITNQAAYAFEQNAIRCFLSLFSHQVPMIKECSLTSLCNEDDKMCELAEEAYENGNSDVGRFLLNFVKSLINVENVMIHNSGLAVSAKKIALGMSALEYGKTHRLPDAERYETASREGAENINGALLRYINGVNSKNIPNHLNRNGYDRESLNALVDGIV